ncbi:hypothetical protein ABTY63_26115 [Streptomyces solisilvae]|uniref:hypothetical protein n=1 Tax=Streptomyces malaysiensis TaxID=92644 RepID=UPI0033202490
MGPETPAKKAPTKKAGAGSTRKKHGETSVTRSKTSKSAVSSKTTKDVKSGQYSALRRFTTGSYSASTEVAQVRLRPDEMADLRLVMESLNLASVSDALREGIRLLAREAAEMAASEEIRTFYQGAPAPTPEGVLPATEDELEAADEIEW